MIDEVRVKSRMVGGRKRWKGKWKRRKRVREAQYDVGGGEKWDAIARLPDRPIAQLPYGPIVLLPNRLINLDNLDCWQNYC